ncbi:hypothetical protein PHLGIDRAFT_474304 [Phlebiopsis gigantea 11061_1 CR5-6]|uniref:Seipin n=1 Tax=Phlebiopsis gigantea (strain 11061_1 CR5-6) TaxID=745531 RepID=A0A0C3S5R9_PHLG1|nr:hypothetical protein PHLGIDRAFT_474304 [Phlebiopsis gigantea 11061_1 CR5-6]
MEDDSKHSVHLDHSSEEGVAEYPWVIRYPLQLSSNLIKTGFQFLRPYAPQLIPLLVFILTIPALLALSLSSGWFVWRSIAVGWEVPVHLQYGDGTSPYAYMPLPTLGAQQPYDISLLLTVPVSQTNLALGNFMATLTLNTQNNKTIASSRRSALVLPPSVPRLSFLWNTPGMVEIAIPLLSNIETGTSSAIAHVELGRQDHWRTLGTGEGRELSVSSALLRGMVVHKGIRGLFTRFPLTTSLMAAITFFFISFVILASCVLPAIEWQVQGDAHSNEQVVPPARRPKRQRKQGESIASPSRRRSAGTERDQSLASRSGPSSEMVKTEEIASTINPLPLRRRRSRLSHPSDSDS